MEGCSGPGRGNRAADNNSAGFIPRYIQPFIKQRSRVTEESAVPFHRIPLDRVCVLIDSIYAFAMTLLVVTIDVPSKYAHTRDLAPVQGILNSVLPDLVHYFIAFVLLAILWYFEHQRFRALRYLDRPLLCLNITSLAFVCLIPFSTNVAGDYPFDYLGAIIFEINIFVIGMIAFIQWLYLRQKQSEFVPDLDIAHISREIRWSLVFPLLSLAGIALALLHVPGSIAVYVVAPLIMAWLFWREPAESAGINP
jgi:uncharacterized membrane protein